MAEMLDAIIVGAGAAGLIAARELVRAGKDIVVLEATERVGGRAMTIEANAGIPVELGAEFVHGDAPETTKLLDEARLVTVPVSGEQYRSDNGELSNQGDAWSRMSRVFEHLNPKRKTDRSFQEFLDEKPGGAKLAREREMARGFVQGFFGADTTLISETSLAEEGDPTEGAAQARRIVNGYGALIDYIARDVRRSIRLNTRVRRIEHDNSSVRVTDLTGRTHSAKAVIVTVPLPILQNDSISIEPDIPEMQRAASKLIMGHVVRVIIVVKERFWEKKAEDVSFVHSPDRPFNVWWTQHPLTAPFVVGWSGGPPALRISEAGNVEDAALTELARVFAMRRKSLERIVDSIHTHDWSHDPHFLGAYAYAGVGGSNAARTLARSFGRVVFAGEATSSESGGTVEGAIATGKRAARKILQL
jgi:monoamine oxidase